MVTQIVPQWKINQIFELSPEAVTQPLRALIIGPAYRVLDAVAGGAYGGQQTVIQWPNRQAGEVVDQSYTTVLFRAAALRFANILASANIQTVPGVPSRLRSVAPAPGFNWKTNGAFLRNAVIPFDPALGDWVRVSNGPINFVTSVVGFDGDPVAAVVGVAGADSANYPTQLASSTLTPDGGNTSDVTTTESAAGYAGQATRAMTETYFIEVVNGSQGGNLGDVVLRVTSASGTDPVQVINGITYGVPTPIGSRGAVITFSAGATPALTDDFVTGDTWSWTIAQVYTAPTATAAGSYAGESDTTYLITVTRGGQWTAVNVADRPIIEVTTTDASDVGVPVTVGAAAVPVGTQGVTITFSAGNALLVAGDQWSIAVTAETVGNIRELILANSLPVSLQGVPLQVELAISEEVEIPANRFSAPPLKNWVTSATDLTLNAGIVAPTASGRTTAELTVVAADAYITYRSLRTALANQVWSFANESGVQAALGADVVDAVLAYGVRRALAAAGGLEVRVLPVESDDLAGYQKALSILKERADFYRIVPLTYDEAVHNAVIAEVNRRSTDVVGRWATTMLGKPLITESQLVGRDTDGAQSLATITDPNSGTTYTRLFDAAGKFITKGIRPGDTVRAKYTTDGFGGVTYQTFTVDTIISEEELDLLAGPSAPVGIASVYEIWRSLTLDEQADDYGRRSSYANRRVTVVFPPNPGRNGVRVPNYFLACTLAAYRCASAPHQGLTNAEVPDWDDLEEASVTFADQLDRLANYGLYIVTQAADGRVYIRKQLTTDLADTKRAEDSATVNVDSMSYFFLDLMSPFIGRANVVPSAIKLIENKLNQGISYLVSNTFTEELGGQLTSGEVAFIRPHAILADRLVVRLNGVIPIPLNNGDMDFVV
jgi:hypothetical protein